MTDTRLLREKIKNSGFKLSALADSLGITRYGLLKKIKNETEFKASEISKIKEVLGLTNEERDKIFFGK